MLRLGDAGGRAQSELFAGVVANKRRGIEAEVGLNVWKEGSLSRTRRAAEVTRGEFAMRNGLREMLELENSGRKAFIPSLLYATDMNQSRSLLVLCMEPLSDCDSTLPKFCP